jgi:hypothetical protein
VPERQNIHPVIKKYAAALLMVSIFVGLIFPALPPIYSPFLAPLVWLLLFLSLVHDEWKGTIEFLKRPGLALLVGVWLFLVSPGIVWLAGQGLARGGRNTLRNRAVSRLTTTHGIARPFPVYRP